MIHKRSHRQVGPHKALVLFALAGIFALASCSTPTPVDPTKTVIPTFTPQNTATPTPSPSPTLTPTTTRTSIPTQTRTPGPTGTTTTTPEPIPSLTAAVPLIESSRYQLVNWSIMDTTRVIDLLQAYPDANFKNKESASYFASFRYALYALQEGILRYPDSLEARGWRWDAAYNMAQIGDDRAAAAYAELIQNALNARQVRPDNLNRWFFNLEPRVVLRPIDIDPLPGFTRSILITLETQGNAYLLLVERETGFQVIPLASLFDFPDPRQFDFAIADLTGDGQEEIVIYQETASADREPGTPLVFAVDFPVITALPFNPTIALDLDIDHNRVWTSQPNELGHNDLLLQSRVFPACPVNITSEFRWNGEQFDLVVTDYLVDPEPDLLKFCESVADHAAANWGAAAARDIVDQLLTLRQDPAAEPITAVLHDKWRLQLGIAGALAGNFAEARSQLESLAQNPQDPEARWTTQGDTFLQAYNSPEAIYPACTTTDLCSDREALAARLGLFSDDDYDLIINQLGLENLPLRASGFYDFEGDETPERWFTFRHPGSIFLDLWILGKGPEGVYPLYVDQIDTAVPEFAPLEDSGTPPAVRLFFQKTFIFSRLVDTGEPYLAPYEAGTVFTVDRVRETWEAARDALLTGTDPNRIQEELLTLERESFFICPYATCLDFVYTLALSSELSGDTTLAVENYHRIWLDYPKNPLAINARLKLIGESFVPTETPTPTRTPRPTRTPTPTPEVTPTSTS